jgi:hypothetical protein
MGTLEPGPGYWDWEAPWLCIGCAGGVDASSRFVDSSASDAELKTRGHVHVVIEPIRWFPRSQQASQRRVRGL